MMNPTKKATLQGMAIDGIFWAAYCSFGSFVVPFLMDSGYSETASTLILTLISTVSFIAQPITGYLCDTRLSERKMYLLLSAAAVPLLLILPHTVNAPVLTMVCLFLLTLALYQVPGLIDSWIIRIKQEHPDLNYGLPRGTGSLMFAITAQVMGTVTVYYGHGARFFMGAVLTLINMVIAFTIRQKGPKERPVPVRQERVSVTQLFKNRTYMLLLAVAFLGMTGSACVSSFMPILAKTLGGDSDTVGSCLAVAALFEVPSMFLMNAILRKVKAKTVILLGSFGFILRLAAHLAVPGVNSLIAIQCLQGVSFALLWPASMNYINQIVSEGLKSTAVMTFTSVGLGISSIFGTALGTVLYPLIGVYGVFAVCTGLTTLGFLLAVFGLAKAKEQPGNF